MTDAEMLAREVYKDPGDGTLRRAYADALMEQPPVLVPCPDCGGGRPGYWRFETDDELRCVRCGRRGYGGSGLVTDAAATRAALDLSEFIKVDLELEAGPPYPSCFRCRGTGKDVTDRGGTLQIDECDDHCDATRGVLKRRAAALRQANPGWRVLACPGCAGSGRAALHGNSGDIVCRACGGTGDLFKFAGVGGDSPGWGQPRGVEFSGGLPRSVACLASELGRVGSTLLACPVCDGTGEWAGDGGAPGACHRCRGAGEWGLAFEVSEWARAVVLHSPVAEFQLIDVLPLDFAESRAVWMRDMADCHDASPAGRVVPGPLFDLLEGGEPGGSYFVIDKLSDRRYPDADAAVADLARAAGKLVRRDAYGGAR